jgi:hypothetical protein
LLKRARISSGGRDSDLLGACCYYPSATEPQKNDILAMYESFQQSGWVTDAAEECFRSERIPRRHEAGTGTE